MRIPSGSVRCSIGGGATSGSDGGGLRVSLRSCGGFLLSANGGGDGGAARVERGAVPALQLRDAAYRPAAPRRPTRRGTAGERASELPKHLLPGSYPKTPQEQAAAAKKYNLTLEDYQTYADDGVGYGDYPKLPDQSIQEKNPWYEWDYPEMRRNFGEPLHRNFDLFVRTRVDTSPTPVPWHIMKKYLWGFIGIMLVMSFVGEMFPAYQPVGPKQFPYNDLYLENRPEPSIEPMSVKHYEI